MPGVTAEPITKEEDYERILTTVLKWRDRLYINLSIRTAFRVNEFRKIKWKDLIKDGSPQPRLTLQQSKVKKPRSVILNREMKQVIVECYILAKQPPLERYVFVAERGNVGYKPMSNTGINLFLAKYQDIMDIHLEGDSRLTTHSLRKTGCLWYFNKAVINGVADPMVATAQFMGHSGPAMTMRYLGKNRDEVDAITMSMCIHKKGTCLQLIESGAFEWKDAWKFFMNGDDEESDLYDYLSFHGNTTDGDEIEAAMNYVKAQNV